MADIKKDGIKDAKRLFDPTLFWDAESVDIEQHADYVIARVLDFGDGKDLKTLREIYADKKLILLKPQKFMNLSGQVIATAVGFYKLRMSDLLVVSDDMALEPGRIRVRRQGSAGGQKGLADIIEKLGTENFARLRIGIGQNDIRDAVDYVLARPTEQQKPLLDKATEKAKQAVLCWIENGIEVAMNNFNRTDE